jgi:hypothetical protein
LKKGEIAGLGFKGFSGSKTGDRRRRHRSLENHLIMKFSNRRRPCDFEVAILFWEAFIINQASVEHAKEENKQTSHDQRRRN